MGEVGGWSGRKISGGIGWGGETGGGEVSGSCGGCGEMAFTGGDEVELVVISDEVEGKCADKSGNRERGIEGGEIDSLIDSNLGE